LLPVGFIIGGIVAGKAWLGFLLGLLILLRPFFSLSRLKRDLNQPWHYALLYAFHSALVIYPQFGGILRYGGGKISNRPLRNKGIAG